MNIEELKLSQCLIFECIYGSQAYGLSTDASDVDIRGVFILPQDQFYAFDYQEQISDEKNNVIYFELRKFLDLLAKNNPNMLELLNIPAPFVLYEHPLYKKIKAHPFVSKLCQETFACYAMSQLKKARGLNKKISNPMQVEKKSILEFCYVLQAHGSVPLMDFLIRHSLSSENCGLVAIPHMRDIYYLFYGLKKGYRGIAHDDQSMDVLLSSVAKGEQPVATLCFNKDGYSRYCKDYKDYWDWVAKRNQERYQSTINHHKNYDAKNMLHVFRLLNMAEEIGRTGQIMVQQSGYRDELLKIKNGEWEYDDLMKAAEERLQAIEEIYRLSDLPDHPNLPEINQLLISIRKEFYGAK